MRWIKVCARVDDKNNLLAECFLSLSSGVDQAVFVKCLTRAIKRHSDYPEVGVVDQIVEQNKQFLQII